MRVYLDNNRATMLDPQVKTTMLSAYERNMGDINSPHYAGSESRKAYLEAIEKIGLGIGATEKDTIMPVSSSDDAVRTLFFGVYANSILTGRRSSIIISEREGSAVSYMADFLERQGCKLFRVPVNSDGIVDADAVAGFISPRTALVSIQIADMETGAINQIDKIAEICAKYDVPFHADANVALGRIPIDVKDLGVDYLTFSGSSVHASANLGIIYAKAGVALEHLEAYTRKCRSVANCGSLDYAALLGLGKAIELASDALDFEMEDVRELRDTLEERLKKIDGIESLVSWSFRLPNTLAVAIEGAHGEMMSYLLDKSGIAVYAASASPYSQWPGSFITDSLNLDASLRHTVVSFALSRFNSEEEIDYLVDEIEKILPALREAGSSLQVKPNEEGTR